ncbi:MAG: hypothetical protein HN802_04820 [Candidatus Jacksonbacteria bacterium]|jgi:hypothetical protein|nr:hypothetical protein [Candidatus Jacksonbacteria bacterium]
MAGYNIDVALGVVEDTATPVLENIVNKAGALTATPVVIAVDSSQLREALLAVNTLDTRIRSMTNNLNSFNSLLSRTIALTNQLKNSKVPEPRL